MARNTHVVKKAQKQLDEVIGRGRLPDHSDINELPYVAAIIKETFRWSPPLPIGVPRRLMEDDIYKGMLIPAGATVIENIWFVRPSRYRLDGSQRTLVGLYVMMRRHIPTQKRSTLTGS
jgi:cytochrome P450